MKNVVKRIFSVTNQGGHKCVQLLGAKIKIRRDSALFAPFTPSATRQLVHDVDNLKRTVFHGTGFDNTASNKILQELMMELSLKNLFNTDRQRPFTPDAVFETAHSFNLSTWTTGTEKQFENLQWLFAGHKLFLSHEPDERWADAYGLWGTWPHKGQFAVLKKAIYSGKPLFIVEGGFLFCIENWTRRKTLNKYHPSVSFIFDDLSPYYDVRRPSRLELMLNDSGLIVTEAQRQRAVSVIKKITDNHVTKYNYQPIFTPNIGRLGVPKVLVVDQSYGDMSIVKGGASEATFGEMLDAAVRENPDADIVVKTHPDTMQSVGGAKGYYSGLRQRDNIWPYTEPVNPISLIQSADKVYVCSSQFGFEALMCGKETHVFGLPFYAGWGLTHDRQRCPRRTLRRDLAEIFYITYILYSHYVNPEAQRRCEIEEAVDYLIKLRGEYFGER